MFHSLECYFFNLRVCEIVWLIWLLMFVTEALAKFWRMYSELSDIANASTEFELCEDDRKSLATAKAKMDKYKKTYEDLLKQCEKPPPGKAKTVRINKLKSLKSEMIEYAETLSTTPLAAAPSCNKIVSTVSRQLVVHPHFQALFPRYKIHHPKHNYKQQ